MNAKDIRIVINRKTKKVRYFAKCFICGREQEVYGRPSAAYFTCDACECVTK